MWVVLADAEAPVAVPDPELEPVPEAPPAATPVLDALVGVGVTTTVVELPTLTVKLVAPVPVEAGSTMV